MPKSQHEATRMLFPGDHDTGCSQRDNAPANIQINRTGRSPDARLPGDPIGAPTYKLFIPASAGVGARQIVERDDR